jgi:small subunit ribosomal protein S16
MVRIRLRRVGAKRQPSYRIVVANSESPRDGRFIEVIGHYNPRTDPPTIEMKEDRALYWLSVGAQPSDPVRRMIDKRGLFERVAEYRATGVVPPAPEAIETPAKPARRKAGKPKAEQPAPVAEAEPVETPEAVAEAEAPEVVAEVEEAEAPEMVTEAEATAVVEAATEGDETVAEQAEEVADEAAIPTPEEVSP